MKKLSMILALTLVLSSAVHAVAHAATVTVDQSKCDAVMKKDKSSLSAQDQKLIKTCEKQLKM